MRELFQALSLLEARLLEQYGVSLNEAMVLCSISGETVAAGAIVEAHRAHPVARFKGNQSGRKKRNACTHLE